MDTWTVGELAAQTGLTVRTLHHYDEIGLARPSQRSSAGHRRYTAEDVRRLQTGSSPCAGFGFGLAEIGTLLDSVAEDPRGLVQRQLDQANDRIARASRLRDGLTRCWQCSTPWTARPLAVLVRLIEEMTAVNIEDFEQFARATEAMMAQLPPGELEKMAERRRRLGRA